MTQNINNQSTQSQKKNIFFARYSDDIDTHKDVLKYIQNKTYVFGERERIYTNFKDPKDQNFILNSEYFVEVENVEETFKKSLTQSLAAQKWTFESAAITGTCGKTSIVQFTSQLLQILKKQPVLTMGSLGVRVGQDSIRNSHLTTPDYFTFYRGLQLAKQKNVNSFLIEMSSQALAESRLDDYQFNICAFTNLSPEHLDFHKTMKSYLVAKTILFTKNLSQTGTCIVNLDSKYARYVIKNSVNSKRTLYLISYKNQKKNYNYIKTLKSKFKSIYLFTPNHVVSTLSGLKGNLVLNDTKNRIKLFNESFETALIGLLNLKNLMISICICHALNFEAKNILMSLKHLKPIPGCLESLHTINSTKNLPHVFVDNAHKPGALLATLKSLRKMLGQSKKIITVFGCGGNRDKTKRPLMGKISSLYSDFTIITSDNPRDENPNAIIDEIKAGITTKDFFVQPDRYLAIQAAFNKAHPGDFILIAGRGNETEQIFANKEKRHFSDIAVANSLLLFRSLAKIYKY